MAAQKKLSSLVMVRMEDSMAGDVAAVAKANQMTKSEVMRLAVMAGLPQLKPAAGRSRRR